MSTGNGKIHEAWCFSFFLLHTHPHVKICLNHKAGCIYIPTLASYQFGSSGYSFDAIYNCWLENRSFGGGKSCCRFVSLARIYWRIGRCMATFPYLPLCAFSNSARELLDAAWERRPLLKTTSIHIIAGASTLICIWMNAACAYCIFFIVGQVTSLFDRIWIRCNGSQS